jgi:hypothetical protein
MAPNEPEDTFKVTDRRRRQDADELPRPAASAPVPPRRGQSSAAPSVAPPSAPADPASGRDRSLAGLFMMLASSAVVALGDAPDPVTGQRQMDLAQAADAIDLLALLREKTDGNRSGEESQILEELIYDLQLRYVRVTKRS